MLNLPSSRGLSSYMIFSSENRERIKAENPEAGFGESSPFFLKKNIPPSDATKRVAVDSCRDFHCLSRRNLAAHSVD